jgi:pimeloyl-ACP methyl ester carboxylesterase
VTGKLLLAFTALALCQAIYSQVFAQQEHEWQFSEVTGNKIAWSCMGEGYPTMVLVAGGGLSAHDSFGRIYHNYDGPGRLCMYDRAGLGESEFVDPRTRTLDQLVDELHQVSELNAWGEFVLVAHSFGGFIARAYAHTYPAEVRGILFLDVAQEDWIPRLRQKMNPDDWAIMERIIGWNERTFHEDYLEAQEAVRATKLRENLPITVLSRGIPHTRIRIERMSYEGIDIFENEHNALQAKVAALSSNSQHRIARYSSHIFNDFDPWVVIDEIKALVKRLPSQSEAVTEGPNKPLHATALRNAALEHQETAEIHLGQCLPCRGFYFIRWL